MSEISYRDNRMYWALIEGNKLVRKINVKYALNLFLWLTVLLFKVLDVVYIISQY